MSLRLGGTCALLALVTYTVGNVAGGLAQPDAYSFANDDISDLGALTANSAWLYNQVASLPLRGKSSSAVPPGCCRNGRRASVVPRAGLALGFRG